MAAKKLQALEPYTACDISDALLKLKVPKAGFIADLKPLAPHGTTSQKIFDQAKTIAPASTVLLVPKTHPHGSDASLRAPVESNIPAGKHYVDLTTAGTVVCLSQPPGQTCAVLGGIMAMRMKMLEAAGIVVDGRVRDLRELQELDFPIWAGGLSTVGTSLEAKPWAIDVPVDMNGVEVNPGDVVFADPVEGVVVIPQDKVDQVIEMLPPLIEAEDRVKEDVKNGSLVKEAFDKHRK